MNRLILTLTLFFLCVIAHAQIIYVNNSATGANTGTSWTDAYTSLQSALTTATSGSTVYIAQGTYYPTGSQSGTNRDSSFAIYQSLKIYGGYDASTGIRNITTTPTILSGDIGVAGDSTDNSYHVMVIAGILATTDSIIIDGLTVTKGNASSNGNFTYGGVVIGANAGGGIAIEKALNLGNTLIHNCIIINNTSIVAAGGMHMNASSPSIVGCQFSANKSSDGGGAQMNASSPTFDNCIFNGNKGVGAGLENSSNSNPYIVNCTFSGNNGGFGAIANWVNCSPKIANCIVYGNSGSISDYSGSLSTVTYSIVQGGFTGAGNLNTDPLFINAPLYTTALFTGGNYQLELCSPAINAGDNDSIPTEFTVDYSNNPRIYGSAVDMGAYEYQAVVPPINRVLYVDSSIVVSGNGKSWSQALKTLSEATAAAQLCSGIDSILVAKGTYYPTGLQSGTNQDSAFVILRGGIKVYGGYDASTGNRNIVTNRTILDGDIGTSGTITDNSYHVVVIAGLLATADSVIVDGFTIQNANGVSGAHAYGSTGIPRNYGGGIALFNDYNGQKTVMRNCLLQNNKTLAGAGMSIYNASPAIANDIFSSNIGTDGGGMQINTTSYPIIENCIITGNKGIGAGIENSNASPYIVNCTISGNSGGSITNWAAATPIIANSIIYGNSGGIGDYAGSVSTVTYSIVQNTFAGTGNINADPLFVNAPSYTTAPFTGGNYQLELCSPAINVADNDSVPIALTTDYINNTRIYGVAVDMGAYEYQTVVPPSNRVLYVDSSVVVSGNGKSWSQALKTLSEATAAAQLCTNIDSILVAKGTYYPTGIQSAINRDSTFLIPVRGGLKIYGGYNSATGLRDITANPSIISGDIGTSGFAADNSYHVMEIAGITATADSTVIDGLTVTGGYGDSATKFNYNGQNIWRSEGGGLDIWGNANMKIAIRNCSFVNNHSVNGGGMEIIFTDSVELTQCSFSNNVINQFGGGLYNYSGKAVNINNCSFSNNIAPSGGGAILAFMSSPIISNDTFLNNNSGTGGGVYIATNIAASNITHSVFTDNVALNGGAILINSSSTNVLIQSCSFTSNSATTGSGGGIYNVNAVPTIDSCIFSGNTAIAANGGGVYVDNISSPGINTVSNSTFENNIANNGGGIYSTSSGSTTAISNTLFTNNTAAINGGGLYNVNSIPYISNCSFLNDTARTGQGGGILFSTISSTAVNQVSNSRFTNNVSTYGGGLSSNSGASVTAIANSSFTGNRATSAGGGGVLSSNPVNIMASVFSNNISQTSDGLGGSGGGLQLHTSGNDSIANTVFANNIAGGTNDDGGGGFMSYGGNAVFTNCTFYGNSTTSTIKPAANGISVSTGATVKVNNTILYGVESVEIFNQGTFVANNSLIKGYIAPLPDLNTDPLFVDAVGGNYRLTKCSPAINAGLNSYLPSTLTKDLDSNVRIFNSIVDMGAYEYQSAVATLAAKPTTTITQPTCAIQTGIINVTAPISGVTYSFDNGATFGASATSPNLIADSSYEVIVQNISGCNSVADTVMIIAAPVIPPAATITITQPTCTVTTGEINITAPTTGVMYSFDNATTFGTNADSATLTNGSYQVIIQNISSGCNSTAITAVINSSLTVPSIPTLSLTQPTCTVTTGEINVTMPSSGVTYSFDNGTTFGTTADSINVVSGTYQVIVQDATSGCNSASATAVIDAPLSVPAIPTLSLTQPTCTVATGEINVTMPSSGVTYSFDNGTTFGTTADSINVVSGTYQVIVQDAISGCNSASATALITTQPVTPVAPTVVSPSIYCQDDAATLTASGTNLMWYTSLGGIGSSVAPNPSTTSVGNSTYYVTQSNGSCESTPASITVTINALVTPIFTAIDPLCLNSNELILPTSSVNGITGTWNNFSVNTSMTGSFTYTFTPNDHAQCAIDTSINITIKDLPVVSIDDTSVITSVGYPVTLHGHVTPTTGTTYYWSPNNNIDNITTLSPSVNPSSSQTYTLTATLAGCTASANAQVTVALPILIPTAFSPNGDGINETWNIDELSNYPTANVEVFNRYGQTVFHAMGNYMNAPWTGNLNGNPLPIGTYFYIINLNSSVPGLNKPISGYIAIVR